MVVAYAIELLLKTQRGTCAPLGTQPHRVLVQSPRHSRDSAGVTARLTDTSLVPEKRYKRNSLPFATAAAAAAAAAVAAAAAAGEKLNA